MAEIATKIEELERAQQTQCDNRANTTDQASHARNAFEPSKNTGVGPYAPHIDRNSPFSEEMQLDPIPKNFKDFTLEYHGNTDPDDHLMRYESMALLHQYTEGVKCIVFLTILVGHAQQRFRKLPRNTIYYFEDLRNLFLHQFASAKKASKSSLHLMTLKQGQNESLREYIVRFNSAVLETPAVDSTIKVHAFMQGLHNGQFFDSLVTQPPIDFEDLLEHIGQYIHLEDAKMTRRAETLRKETKAEEIKKPPVESRRGPDRGGQMYTLLTQVPTDLLEIVVKKLGVFLPPSSGDPPRNPKSDKFCKFHNDYRHKANDCRNLKAAIEKLIQEG